MAVHHKIHFHYEVLTLCNDFKLIYLRYSDIKFNYNPIKSCEINSSISLFFQTFILLHYIPITVSPLLIPPRPSPNSPLPQINSSSVSLPKGGKKTSRPPRDIQRTWLNNKTGHKPHITARHGNPVGEKASWAQTKVSQIPPSPIAGSPTRTPSCTTVRHMLES